MKPRSRGPTQTRHEIDLTRLELDPYSPIRQTGELQDAAHPECMACSFWALSL